MTYETFQQLYAYNPDTNGPDFLGSGGFGKVFRADDRNNDDDDVALKIADTHHSGDYRLTREVALAQKVSAHKNIAKYHHSGTFSSSDGDKDFAVMKYYQEGDLKKMLARHPALSINEKTALLRGILEGIAHLHQHQIIWRDCKPGNVLLSRDKQGAWVPKLSDFGLGKSVAGDDGSQFSKSMNGGTLAYCSPEQLNPAVGKLSYNTDLWSFGVLAYWLFSGQLPFDAPELPGESEARRMEMARKIQSGELPADLDSSLPAPVAALVRACLVADPAQRIKSAEAGLEMLEGKATISTPPQPEELPTEPPAPNPSPVKTTPMHKKNTPSWLRYGLLAVAFALLLGAYWWYSGAEERDIEAGIRAMDIEMDYYKAREIFEKYPKNGKALSILAYMYYVGNGADKNAKKGLSLYQRSMDLDSPYGYWEMSGILTYGDTELNIAKDSVKSREYEKIAFEGFKKLAEHGDIQASLFLSIFYNNGIAIDKDTVAAFKCIKNVAKTGHYQAQFALGCSYKNGSGVEKDEKKAFELIQKSAEQGFPAALNLLSEMYLKGIGTKTDEKLAEELKNKAMEKSHSAYDMEKLAEDYKQGKTYGINEEKANYWYRKALNLYKKRADKGDTYAIKYVGDYYREGLGVPKNEELAREYYGKLRPLANKGDKIAQYFLGFLHQYGYYYGRKDIPEAIKWYCLAMAQGDETSEIQLRHLGATCK
jgi:serine/threonine protein kinase